MTDRPILFSAPMVRALLDDRKTQTRRILKHGDHFPNSCLLREGVAILRNTFTGIRQDVPLRFAISDRLWVRESWQLHSRATDFCSIVYKASVNHSGWTEAHEQFPDVLAGTMKPRPFQEGWSPSIHMPRWASRLTLTVTDIRVERLQDISAKDSIAEGVKCQTCFDIMAAGGESACKNYGCFASKTAYENLWNSINGKNAWDQNPWVVALTFTVEKRNIDR